MLARDMLRAKRESDDRRVMIGSCRAHAARVKRHKLATAIGQSQCQPPVLGPLRMADRADDDYVRGLVTEASALALSLLHAALSKTSSYSG